MITTETEQLPCFMFESTTGTQVLAKRCGCCCCCVLRPTRSLVSCLASSLLLTFVHSWAKCKKLKHTKKKHFETSLNAADFYTNQHETSFCHFVLEDEEKTGSGNVHSDFWKTRSYFRDCLLSPMYPRASVRFFFFNKNRHLCWKPLEIRTRCTYSQPCFYY